MRHTIICLPKINALGEENKLYWFTAGGVLWDPAALCWHKCSGGPARRRLLRLRQLWLIAAFGTSASCGVKQLYLNLHLIVDKSRAVCAWRPVRWIRQTGGAEWLQQWEFQTTPNGKSANQKRKQPVESAERHTASSAGVNNPRTQTKPTNHTILTFYCYNI